MTAAYGIMMECPERVCSGKNATARREPSLRSVCREYVQAAGKPHVQLVSRGQMCLSSKRG
jgi:hypothetical protein